MKEKILIAVRCFFYLLCTLCMLESYFVVTLNTGTNSYLVWVFIAAFFYLIAFLMGKNRWKKIPLLLRKIAVGVLIVCVSLFLIVEILILSKFTARAKPDADCIIVLGAQIYASGPSLLFRQRLDTAYDYLVENPDTVCIVTGAQGDNEPVSEGSGGRNYLIARGIDPSRIYCEESSFNTRENIENAYEIIKEKLPNAQRIAVVTNNFHVFRGMFLAKKITGLSVEGIAAPATKRFLPTNMLREPFGVVKDAFFVVFE